MDQLLGDAGWLGCLIERIQHDRHRTVEAVEFRRRQRRRPVGDLFRLRYRDLEKLAQSGDGLCQVEIAQMERGIERTDFGYGV